VLLGLDISDFWGRTAELGAFSPACESSFAFNLLYSLLLKFGSFSGQRMDTWADTERLRIKAALAETPQFNAAAFEINVNALKLRWRRAIKYSNVAVILWAAVAVATSVALLVAGVTFYGKTTINAPVAMWAAVVLFGAIPIGLFSCGILHSLAKINMRWISHEWLTSLDYIKESPTETIAEARQALLKKPRAPGRSRKNPIQADK
jgi:hypothetical protein